MQEQKIDRGNSIKAVSRRLDVSVETVRRLVAARELKAVRVSARRLIVMDSEIADYIARRTMAA